MSLELHYYIILTFIIGLVVGYYFYKNPMGCGDYSSPSCCSPVSSPPACPPSAINGEDILKALTEANLIN